MSRQKALPGAAVGLTAGIAIISYATKARSPAPCIDRSAVRDRARPCARYALRKRPHHDSGFEHDQPMPKRR